MSSVRARWSGLVAVALACAAPVWAAKTTLPPAVSARLAASGLPLASFGVLVQRVDAPGPAPLVSLNAERSFQLASTTKLVTALAALDLLAAPAGAAARPTLTLPAPGEDDAGDLDPDADAGADRTDAAAFLKGSLIVTVRPAAGGLAAVTLQPHPPGVTVLNEVAMDGACGAWAQWREDRPGTLWVRGRWNEACGAQEIARVRPRASAVQRIRHAAATALTAPARALAALGRDLPSVLRAMNKTSDNALARSLLLQLAPAPATGPGAALRAAQARVHKWLRTQGLAEGDIRVDVGSGQSRLERGKPRAMVALLRRAWRGEPAGPFVDSLPVAGVDGTLSRRLRDGPAAGRAWLKTGTLHDTRALAGYVRGRSGKVYAFTAIVNHPRAARATPALDAVVEWVATHG